ncbi:hypothetical protein [Streptomyces sp. NBC_01363]|uniref:hypothetical protein n=1 Tax=Streptomyces sp. NBC_01363 TaxID=2903840 RepID=UPI002250F741|nr:hypothetical protein [Streptomyces sp. NBC_01363]MCX4734565.1 hypothetical protein [Streptomyces sp. NBC_01363]
MGERHAGVRRRAPDAVHWRFLTNCDGGAGKVLSLEPELYAGTGITPLNPT